MVYKRRFAVVWIHRVCTNKVVRVSERRKYDNVRLQSEGIRNGYSFVGHRVGGAHDNLCFGKKKGLMEHNR